jgi:hypothetical protein
VIPAALVAAAAVKLAPMAEPFVVTDATSLARWEFDKAPSLVEWRTPAQYPPEAGMPGYGWPSRIEDYKVDGALAERLAERPGLEAHWFIREPIAGRAAEVARELGNYTDSIPFLLFRPRPHPFRWWNPIYWFCRKAKVPLVVYMPGNGEMGTDLSKQFRQTGVIDRVLDAAFQDKHRTWLLVPMPPLRGNVNVPHGYPVEPRAPLITLYNDLVLKVVELSHENTGISPPIDKRRIYLTGLGCGGSMAVAMSFDHPGRYAATAVAWSRPHHQPVLHPDAPGNWWFGFEEQLYADAIKESRNYYDEFWRRFRTNVERFGGSFELRTYSKRTHECWWDSIWKSDEFWVWCFNKKSNGEVEVVK